MEEQNGRSAVKTIIYLILVCILAFILCKVYSMYNYNDYIKAEYVQGKTQFSRDSNEKYESSKMDSYKVENKDYNDSMFYKKIEVKPNTSYKVSCMIKTEGVKTKNNNMDAGAHICIGDTVEKSDNVVGTSDWTKIEFLFDSKNRKEVNIGFRLGGYADSCIGTAWFSDMEIVSGVEDESNTWNFLCLIFNNTNVNVKINGSMKNVKFELSDTDVADMELCMQRFANSLQEMSENKIKSTYDIFQIQEPIRSMSYDETNGYYVSAYDIKDVLSSYISQGKYDHIFVAFRTGDINKQSEIPVNDWIGLGSMEYRNIGFSNIRLPNDDKNYIYKYDGRINTFPEEVYIHEFLHTLERNSEEYGYSRPELHSNEQYGYQNQKLTGLQEWYRDYLNCAIKAKSGNIGLPNEIFTKKPVKSTDFTYAHKLDSFKEPENIIENIRNLGSKVIRLFSRTEKINSNMIENTVTNN